MTGFTIAIDARLVSGTNTGDSTYWTELIRALAKTPESNRYLLFTNADPPKTIPEDPRFHWRKLPARSSRWWSMISFPLAARKLKADVIHTQYALSPLVGSHAVTTVHDVSFFIGPEWFRPKDRVLLRTAVPAACRRAARVIAVSETCGREIEQWIPAARGKIRVVPNACPTWIERIDRDRAKKLVAERFSVRERYLLTVGTRWPRKNMQLAIEAVQKLAPPMPLVITGKPGWGEQAVPEGVRPVGYVDTESLSALYSAAELYLAPSKHEGFGIPVLEAFRCGCPVLCSSGGAFPEVAGDAAVVEPSWSPDHWAATIQSLLSDRSKLNELQTRGEERERRFSWEDAAVKTLAVYREALT